VFARIALLTALATAPGCDSDWDGPFAVQISVQLEGEVDIRIGGVTGTSYVATIDGEGAAAATALSVESLVDGQVAETELVDLDCDDACGQAEWSSFWAGYCAYGSRELRQSAFTCMGESGQCHLDSFCRPRCSPDYGCGDGSKCGLKRLPFDLTRGWLACVPAGSAGEGESCSIDSDGIDDCASGLHCEQGTCVYTCILSGNCPPPSTCQHVDAITPDIGACLPP
jgi:hypothetical protein